MKLVSMVLLALSLLIVSLFTVNGAPAAKPHIVFIMIDDYGWSNIGYHNSSVDNAKEIVTPTLNKLAAEGIELDRHYAYKFCSPTRCAFLTGRNPIHVNAYNLETNYNPSNNISGYAGVPINMTMISAKMKTAGYATHYTGKWDAGWATPYHLPINRGFDTALGYLQHANDYWQYTAGCAYDLWNNNKPGVGLTNPLYCNQNNQTHCVYEDDLFVAQVMKDLDAHDPKTPLFYYYALHNIHAPLEVPQAYLNKFSFIPDVQRQHYAAMVNHMDDTVAMVIQKLVAKGMWNDTLIVVSADNGGPVYPGGGANNFPLKGGKMSNWEGGIRVNAFISGGFVPQEFRGSISQELIAISDWYSTFCNLAGVDPTDTSAAKANLPGIDSYNIWPLLTGKNNTNPRTELAIGTDNGGNGNFVTVQGIIVPPYKLLLGDNYNSFWQGPLYPNVSTNFTHQVRLHTDCGTKGCLFNIFDDPSEHFDVASQYPAVVARMMARINYHNATVFNVDRGMPFNYCASAKGLHNGFFGPFVTPIF